MFIGHYAVAFAAKRAAPRLSLGVLVAASQLIDLIWPLMLLAGVERVRIAPGITRLTPLDFQHYPYTHSLVAVIGWGVLAAAIVFVLRRRLSEAAIVGGVVVSHWLLDAIVHRPDLPLALTGDARVGLGLWNSVAGSIVLEAGLFVAGVVIYSRVTRARDRIGKIAWWSFAGFLAIIYVGNLFGPPPPSVNALASTALALWLTPLWAWWADRHREVRAKSEPEAYTRFTKTAARR